MRKATVVLKPIDKGKPGNIGVTWTILKANMPENIDATKMDELSLPDAYKVSFQRGSTDSELHVTVPANISFNLKMGRIATSGYSRGEIIAEGLKLRPLETRNLGEIEIPLPKAKGAGD